MTAEEIYEQIRTIASDVFECPAEDISLETSPDAIATWDSVRHLYFVLAIEQACDIQFSPDEVGELLSIELTCMLVAEILAR